MTESITLGGGCFWCLDAAYRRVKGIESSICGYAGGDVSNPTYEMVCTGTTGHAEVVQLHFNPDSIGLDTILDIFWAIHNPTTPNRQGNDVGSQYRSIILYHDHQQKQVAEASMRRVSELWDEPIVTQILPLQKFYKAEEEHQNYFTRHPEVAYCQVVINPKLHKLQQQFQKFIR